MISYDTLSVIVITICLIFPCSYFKFEMPLSDVELPLQFFVELNYDVQNFPVFRFVTKYMFRGTQSSDCIASA